MATSPVYLRSRLANCQQRGDDCEANFAAKFFEDHGWSYKPSSRHENIYKHFDAIVTKKEETYKIEVKAIKYNRNPSYQGQVLLLFEWQGISGHPGWSRGEADFIFQQLTPEKFVIYDRQQVENKLLPPSNSIARFSSKDAPIGKWFGRTGLSKTGQPNKDIIRWESLSFLDGTKHRFYVKQKGNWLPL